MTCCEWIGGKRLLLHRRRPRQHADADECRRGQVTDTDSYDAFGSLGASAGTTANPFLFGGQQYDAPTGTYYLRARYYAPADGRFISHDRFGGNSEDPISLHRYLYSDGDPVYDVDPGGNEEFSLGSVTASIGIGATLGGISGGVADYALTGNVSLKSVLTGAALGGVLGPVAGLSPYIATTLGLIGVASSASVIGKVFTDPTATPARKFAAAILLVASVAGTGASGRQAIEALQSQQEIVALTSGDAENGALGMGEGPGTDLVSYYPPSHGFDGEHGYEFLSAGKILDRFYRIDLPDYYPGRGRYLANEGTSQEKLSLPPGQYGMPFKYVVLKPFAVDSGKAASFFGQPGGGHQYFTGDDVQVKDLVEWGFLGPK